MPINPSDGFTSTASPLFGGASGTGGTTTTASADDTPIGGMLASMPSGSEGPTPGVKITSAPPASSDEPGTVAMASPKTEGAASGDTSSGFGLDGPAFAGGPLPSGMSGTMMLAGLIGVGVLGAGWAWKSLVV
jgi:hypothetical protein